MRHKQALSGIDSNTVSHHPETGRMIITSISRKQVAIIKSVVEFRQYAPNIISLYKQLLGFAIQVCIMDPKQHMTKLPASVVSSALLKICLSAYPVQYFVLILKLSIKTRDKLDKCSSPLRSVAEC